MHPAQAAPPAEGRPPGTAGQKLYEILADYGTVIADITLDTLRADRRCLESGSCWLLPEPAPAGTLPDACDVLIIGAGPSGSACATVLAGAGLQVCLVDQHDFPREKVCGDGLIPDAHAALARLGLLDEVMRHATRVSHVRCVAPRGGQVDVPGRLAVLPRRQLDLLLYRHAECGRGRGGSRR